MTPDDPTPMLDNALDRIEQKLLPRAATVLEALLVAAEGRGAGTSVHEIATALQDLSREMQVLDQQASGATPAHDRGETHGA